MSDQSRILLMTGSRLRHLAFAAAMAKQFHDVSLIVERFHESTGRNYTNDDVTPMMREHFAQFDRIESRAFKESVRADSKLLAAVTRRTVGAGEINNDEVVAWINNLQPDVIVVYSTSIIEEPLISAFPNRILNLHAGLSPYYRGAGTNLFPFYNGELEYVGMTVHYLDAGIDSGNIILQARPDFDPHDNPHTISCKNVLLGVQLMSAVLKRFLDEGPPEGCKQDLSSGRLYRKKDFSDEVLERINQRLETGLVQCHIEDSPSVEIVSWE